MRSGLRGGWRIPFLISSVMLGGSLYIRMQLHESPVFMEMKARGECAKTPLRDSFATRTNVRAMLVVGIGIAAGLTVIYYCAEFYSLYFLGALQVGEVETKWLVALPIVAIAPFVVLFGWLSDRVGRKPVQLAGYGLTLLLLFPAFHQMARGANPALAEAAARAPVVVTGADCRYDVFAAVQASPCARVLDQLAKRGVSYAKRAGPELEVRVGAQPVAADPAAIEAALAHAGYPRHADPARIDPWRIGLAVFALGLLSACTVGAVAAILVEMFPARIRYTSISLPYHIGTGYFGGFLPFVTQYIVARTGDAFAGLWYVWIVVAVAFVVTLVWLPETRGRDVTC